MLSIIFHRHHHHVETKEEFLAIMVTLAAVAISAVCMINLMFEPRWTRKWWLNVVVLSLSSSVILVELYLAYQSLP